MEAQRITLVAQAKDGKITVSAEIAVPDGAGTYLVTIAVAPQLSTQAPSSTLDQLYGALADTPLPELIEEKRRDRC